jgi:hypothetical protein
VPTAALLAAVLKMVRHEGTERVLLEFCRGLVGSTVLSDQTRSLLMQRLSGDQPEVVQGMDLVPFSVRSSLPEKRRPRDWLRDQWPLKG